MKYWISPKKTFFWILLVFPVCAMGISFRISYQQDASQVLAIGQLAWSHLLYAEELKDDMAIIDWAKNLEKLDNVRAFQAKLNSKPIAEGGNRDFLANGSKEGIEYLFPSDWSFRSVSVMDPQNSKDFVLVYHSWPGPFLWGLIAFTFCFVTGCVSELLGRQDLTIPTTMSSIPKPDKSQNKVFKKLPTQPASSNRMGGAFLFIDKNYIIQEVTPLAAELFRKNQNSLLSGHLLDLAPDPLLIQAIENAEEAKLQTPFPDLPWIRGTLKPDPNGSILILENTEASETV